VCIESDYEGVKKVSSLDLRTLGKGKFSSLSGKPRTLCPVCGSILAVEYRKVISDKLASDWALDEATRGVFDYREGSRCRNCSSSKRIRNLAAAILDTINTKYSLRCDAMQQLAKESVIANLRVAEINNCQALHARISFLPNLFYSEYGSVNPSIPSEDVTSLTYPDEMFDFVLMTDVLEHVPDYRKGLEEIKRVMAFGGFFITTVPILPTRPTRTRAVRHKDGSVQFLLPPSYHGDSNACSEDMIVYHEFGIDFIGELCERFFTRIYCFDAAALFTAVFVCQRQ